MIEISIPPDRHAILGDHLPCGLVVLCAAAAHFNITVADMHIARHRGYSSFRVHRRGQATNVQIAREAVEKGLSPHILGHSQDAKEGHHVKS